MRLGTSFASSLLSRSRNFFSKSAENSIDATRLRGIAVGIFAALVTVIPKTSPQDAATTDLVHRLRDDVVPDTLGGTGINAEIGGVTPALEDQSEYMKGRLPLFTIGVVGLSFLVSFLIWNYGDQTGNFAVALTNPLPEAVRQATIDAGRNLGASRLRVLIELVLPQVMQTLLVGLVLSFVTMLSVLSVPMMVAGSQPTMLTVDMAFRINFYGDYGVANALGFVSYVMTGVVAWIYLRQGVRQGPP